MAVSHVDVNHTSAKLDLLLASIAVDQLKRYEKLVGQNRGSEVNALHQEITQLTNELEKGTPSESERKKMAGQISEWWNGATKWFRNKTK